MKISIGDHVVVSDPKHADSVHSFSFDGTVIDIVGDKYLVEDQDSDIFMLEQDEIEEIIT